MRILTWNILNGGRDPDALRQRWDTQARLIRELDPDVLLMQEARGFDANGSALLLEAEAELDRRGFMAIAPHTGQNTAIFIKSTLRPLRTEHDTVHFHHALARLDVEVPGLDRRVRLASIHLSPLSPVLRTGEVGWLAGLAAPDVLSIVAGDANSLAPTDPEPKDWQELSSHFRVRYLSAQSSSSEAPVADRGALAFLHAAGFVDAASQSSSGSVDTTPTVPTRGYPNVEFVAFRSDHVLLSPAIAPARSGYRVITDDRAHLTSDHLPVLVELDLDRIQ